MNNQQSNDQMFQVAANFCGYLEKKSPSIFTGYQKRWFYIIDGKLLAYAEKKEAVKGSTKGAIPIADSVIKTVDQLNFQVIFEDRTFDLRGANPQEVQAWINNLSFLKKYLTTPKQMPGFGTSPSKKIEDDDLQTRQKGASVHKTGGHKLQNLDKDSLEILKKTGTVVSENRDEELSKKMLALKGIEKHFKNVPKTFLEGRWAYGFLGKRHKSSYEIYQKRWFFLISSRPLTDKGYENDDQVLEEKVLPSFLSFDVIYYFNAENDTDNSPSAGDIPLYECHGVEVKDMDKKYNLMIDMGDRKYEVQSEIKGERDLWFEYIKNSRKTAKDVKNSITKRPRNINKLCNILEANGEEKLRKLCEDERDKIINNYKDIKDFETLSFVIENIQKPLLQTLDGLCLTNPPKTDIIKIYIDTFDGQILTLVQNYWKTNNEHMSTTQMIELSNLLFTYDEKLSNFGITDPNFGLNGRELIKIFAKKTYLTMRQLVENILKSERETKFVKDGDGILITNGPTDISNLINKSLTLIKNEKRKSVFEQFLKISKECVLQYLSGNDYLIGRNDLEIDKEFLVAIINNVMNLNLQIGSLKDEVASLNILDEKEIETNIEEKAIFNAVNLVTITTLNRFVLEMIPPVAKAFGSSYIDVNLENVMQVAVDTYGVFIKAMNMTGQKRLWIEILKAIIFLYIKSLLTTAHRKVKKINDLTDKLKNDINFLLTNFEQSIGKNTAEINLKILYDFLEFLDVSVMTISMSCSKLREFNGPAFTLQTAKSLINLRVDFSSEEKKEAIESCKDILEHLNKSTTKKKGTGNSMLEMLGDEIKRDEKEEKENETTMPTVEQSNARRKTVNLADFLIADDEEAAVDNEEEDDEEEDEQDKQVFQVKTTVQESDTDAIKCGYMKKKAHSSWQERYFQLKNFRLYWYISENARESQNNINLREIKKCFEHKEGKFLLESADKVYKFECKDKEDSKSWQEAINGEMKKIKNEDTTKKLENIYEAKMKPKVITSENFTNLPNFNKDKFYMRKKVENDLKTEKFFAVRIKPTITKKETIISADNQSGRMSISQQGSMTEMPMEGTRSDMSVLLIENPSDDEASASEKSCSDKMGDCWISIKEKLGC